MRSTLPQTDHGNDIFEIEIRVENLPLDVSEIGKVLGYYGNKLDAHFSAVIQEIIDSRQLLCDIRAGYRLVDVFMDEKRSDGIIVGGKFFETDKIIASYMKKATQAALFACTIGPSMELQARSAFGEGDPLKGHFIDTVASVTAEKAAGLLHDQIENTMASKGLGVTNRFSPGYCGWILTQQHLLFSFFPPGFCGISLTDSALMIPVKSVSGIIGIGANVKKEDYFCGRCGRKDCTYRAFRAAASVCKP